MKYNLVNRRMFLQGLGSTLAIPFLPSIANAAMDSSDPIFIYLAFNQGHPRQKMWPWNKTVPFVQTDTETKMRKLSDIIKADGKISTFFDANWNKYADQLNIITHLNMFGTSWDHNPFIGGAASANWMYPLYTLDHCIKEAWIKKGYNGKIPLLCVNIGREQLSEVYAQLSCGMTSTSDKKPGRPYPTIENVQKLALALNGAVPPVSGSSQALSEKKLVDSVLADYKNLVNDKRLSAIDKNRLNDAMDQWNDIQNRTNTVSASCTLPGSISTVNLGEQNRLATDMILAAINCGITRVVSHQIVHVADSYVGAEPIHNMAHGGGEWLQGFTWRFQFMRDYADKLSSVKDSNGEPLFKKSLVFNATEYTDYGNHELLGRGIVTMGDGGGRLKSGYHVHGGHAPYQRAHMTVMKALGLSQAEIELSGQPGFGEYVNYTENYVEDGLWRFGSTTKEDGIFKLTDSQKYQSDVEKRKILTGLV